MVYIIVGIILGATLNLKINKSYIKVFGIDSGIVIENIASGFVGLLVGVLTYVIIGSIIGCSLPTKEIVTTQEICALNDGTKIEGSYYLFSGYIDEKLTFRYVVNTERGKQVLTANSDYDVYTKEGNYNKPYVENHEYKFKKEFYYWFAINVDSADNYTIFYVPENTVTNEYNIDLK